MISNKSNINKMEIDNNNKKNFLLKLEMNYKLQIIVCLVLSSIAVVSLMIINKVLDERNYHKYTLVDDINLINSVEKIKIDHNMFELHGYAFMLDRSSLGNSISVFLKNVDTGEEIWLDTKQVNRNDVNIYYDCEHNYINSGFVATTEAKIIDNEAIYEILINIDYRETNKIVSKKIRKTVSTNRYIQKDNIYKFNPDEFDKPDINIASKLLKDVFTYGQLCFYKKDVGMYVYQYNNKLFWVATRDFEFEQNGLTYIPYQLFTSQADKLPENRKQYKYDNLDFYFENYEYKEELTSPYRVAYRDIPNDYVIAYIKTGVYDNIYKKWIWEENFNLDNIIVN